MRNLRRTIFPMIDPLVSGHPVYRALGRGAEARQSAYRALFRGRSRKRLRQRATRRDQRWMGFGYCTLRQADRGDAPTCGAASAGPSAEATAQGAATAGAALSDLRKSYSDPDFLLTTSGSAGSESLETRPHQAEKSAKSAVYARRMLDDLSAAI